jgi:hypothetical protein
VRDLFSTDFSNGDVIWKSGCEQDQSACLKPEYLAAVEASKDLWVAFMRAHRAAPEQRESNARAEVSTFSDRWLKQPQSVADAPKQACARTDPAKLEARRAACLRATGIQTGERSPPFAWSRGWFSDIP